MPSPAQWDKDLSIAAAALWATAVAWILSLGWELPQAMGTDIKKKKKKEFRYLRFSSFIPKFI